MSNVATQVIDHFVSQVGAQAATWLQSCVHCGECAEACHFYEVTKDPRYTPAWKLEPFARAYRARKAPFAGMRKALGLAKEPDEAELNEWQELIYDSCTMCGRCTMVCPMGIDIAALVGLARKSMAANGIGPEDLFAVAEKSREVGSPLGVTPEKMEERIDWLSDEHEVDIPLNKEKAEVLLTISSVETMKYPQSIVAMAQVLNHAGIDWTFSTKGYEATNFGVLSGKADVAKVMIERIVAA
ncbi:MAG: (Fe-S)-binding protein, partial [Alphaproteobacteria bacterium]|nr:(Fe-S)-binding protein [Alphaproteobacteria bacterium]